MRYSAYILNKIFRLASVDNQIVGYYARLLAQAQSFSINDFPVGVGCDEVMPYLMTDKEFKRSFEGLFDPASSRQPQLHKQQATQAR